MPVHIWCMYAKSLSEALPMHHLGAYLVVFCFGYPHWHKCRQGGQYWPSYPYKELSLGWSNHSNLHRAGCQRNHLFRESFRDTWEHSASSTHYYVAIEIFADIYVALHYRLISYFVESWHFISSLLPSQVGGFEECFRTSESLVADRNHLAVWQLEWFIFLRGLIVSCIGSILHLCSAS